jgi:hypothetical protein
VTAGGEWASPLGGRLEGYPDEIVRGPGETVRFMLGGPESEAQVRLVRLRHGDANPLGPGWKEEEVDWGQPSRVRVAHQPLALGSYVEIPHAGPLVPAGPFTLALWFYPTARSGGWQTLAAKSLPDELSFALFYCGFDSLTAAISRDGVSAGWLTAHDQVQLGVWQLVALTHEPATGEVCLYQWLRGSERPPTRSSRVLEPGPLLATRAARRCCSARRPRATEAESRASTASSARRRFSGPRSTATASWRSRAAPTPRQSHP